MNRMHCRCGAALAAALFLSTAALVSAEGPEVLDLAACVARALAAGDALRAAEAQAEAQDSRVAAARAQRLPGLTLSGSYVRSAEVAGGELTVLGNPVTLPSPLPDSFAARLQVQETVYAGGRIDAGIRAASALASAAAAQRASARAAAAGSAERAYWNLYLAQESEAAALDNLRAMESHRRDAEDRLARGAATRSEVLSWRLREVQARDAAGGAGTRRAQAAASLALLLGLPWDSDLRAAPPPEAASREEPVDVGAAVRAALESRRDIAESDARAASQGAALDQARGALLPTLQLTGSFSFLNPNPKVFPQREGFEPYWEAGILASWDAGGLPGNLARVREAEASLRAARYRSDAARRGAEAEVVAAAIALQDARRRLAVTAAALDLALENRRVAEDRYAAGIALDAELADAEAALTAARLESLRARAARELAEAALRDAAGGSAESPVPGTARP